MMKDYTIENLLNLKETIAAEFLKEEHLSMGSSSGNWRFYCKTWKYSGSGRV